MQHISHKVNETAVRHFIDTQKPIGILPELHAGHSNQIMHRTIAPMRRLVEHLQTADTGGDFSAALKAIAAHKAARHGGTLTGGTVGTLSTGGRLTGGGLGDFGNVEVPNNNQEMYHYLLMMSPHQLEMMREISAQILGGHHSPMWGPLISKQEPLEAEPEDYENVIRMPNTHAAARMLEAEHGTGGGFGKALRHVGRIAKKIYKAGHHALKFVNRNKDVLMDLVPEQYQGAAEGFLETANRIDSAVNPLVDAAIDAASKSGTSQESREKLKKMAEQSIDKAIETHLPNAKKYIDVAKDAYSTIRSQGADPNEM